MHPHVIELHVDAPPKPAVGMGCNGCGVCCASEPCPLGRLVTRRREGRCAALAWNERTRRYRCGMVESPAAHLPRALRGLAPLLGRLARRWIASGTGCDSDAIVERPSAALRRVT